MKDASAAKQGVQPRRRRLSGAYVLPLWALIGGAAVVAVIGTYPYYGSNAYVLSLLGKFLCFAIFALSIDLIWGFTGILSLGQAVYFGIGAYFVALSLKINYALTHPTRYGGKFPDFMEWNGLTELPRFHDAADQHAVCRFLRAGGSDAAGASCSASSPSSGTSTASIAR